MAYDRDDEQDGGAFLDTLDLFSIVLLTTWAFIMIIWVMCERARRHARRQQHIDRLRDDEDRTYAYVWVYSRCDEFAERCAFLLFRMCTQRRLPVALCNVRVRVCDPLLCSPQSNITRYPVRWMRQTNIECRQKIMLCLAKNLIRYFATVI